MNERRQVRHEDFRARLVLVREHVLDVPALEIEDTERRILADGGAEDGVNVRAFDAGTIPKTRIEECRRRDDHLARAQRLRDDAARDELADLGSLVVRTAGGAPPRVLLRRVLLEELDVPLL